MPAFLTHRVAAERVLEAMRGGIVHKKAFYLGCQGPDLLYFRNFQPWRSARESFMLGISMHGQHIRELMNSALEYTRRYTGTDKDELISYIAGFVTHYAIDKNAHPFVYGKAGTNTGMHHAIEFMWDSFAAKEQWDIEPQVFDIKAEVMYDEVCDGICTWYQAAAKDVYQKDLPPRAVRQAQKHLATAKNMLANIGLAGRMLIRVVSRIIGFDVGTMLYPDQRDTSVFTGEEYRGMQDMLSRGVNEACDMLGFALDYISGNMPRELPSLFGDRDFAGRPVSAEASDHLGGLVAG